jgi:hypothetical protein
MLTFLKGVGVMEKSVRQMVPAAMISLREKIQAWRGNKQQRRMPEELWAEAVRLAREHGVHPVSKNVEVSYTRLKRLVDGNCSAMAKQRFVEVLPPRQVVGVQVEIHRTDGCRLTVVNADTQTVSSMAAAFLGMRR